MEQEDEIIDYGIAIISGLHYRFNSRTKKWMHHYDDQLLSNNT